MVELNEAMKSERLAFEKGVESMQREKEQEMSKIAEDVA